MHTCVTYRPRNPAPPELLPMLVEGSKQWLDRYGDRFQTLWFFPQGGGFGVSEITDEAEIMEIMAYNPFTPYCDVDVQICVEARAALTIYERMVNEQMAAMSAGAPAR
jgi:hypothetical protein